MSDVIHQHPAGDVIQPRERPVRAERVGPAGTPVVVGVDMGTTSVKALAVDPDMRVWASGAKAYPLQSPRPGWAEQDPDAVADATITALTDVVAAARDQGATVEAVALGAAMHSVLAVDETGRPLTAALTYADSRARTLAEAVRATASGTSMYRRTGVPHHAMAPLHKIRWFNEHDPAVAARTARWISLKEHALAMLGVAAVADHSIASGTGLFDLRAQRWDDEAMALAGISADALSPLAASSTVVDAPGLGVPLVVGAGDGALANLGAGALDEGVAGLSIGTSGAVRVGSREVRTDDAQRLFCAALVGGHWVVGGAISNGGVVLRWLRDALFGGAASYEQLTAQAADVAPGSEGLLFVPHLVAERGFRSAREGAALAGLTLGHGAGHMVRAALEGVAFQLRWVAGALTDSGCAVDAIRATGGFTASPLWVQILADVLQRPVGLPTEAEGSAVGAALLGMVAIGLVDGVDAAAHLVRPATVVEPRPEHAAVYDAACAAFLELAGD